MSKYRVELCFSDGDIEEDDEIFETEAEAEEHGLYLCSCYHTGQEVLYLSDPIDNPIDEDDDVDFEIIEIDE